MTSLIQPVKLVLIIAKHAKIQQDVSPAQQTQLLIEFRTALSVIVNQDFLIIMYPKYVWVALISVSPAQEALITAFYVTLQNTEELLLFASASASFLTMVVLYANHVITHVKNANRLLLNVRHVML